MRANFVFFAIIFAGGIAAGAVNRAHPDFNPVLITFFAFIFALGVRAKMLGVFPKQLWGPGTIPSKKPK